MNLKGPPIFAQFDLDGSGRDAGVFAAARLDNAEAIREAVGSASPVGPSDSDLVISAYRRWDVDCLNRLRGDWSLAAWCPHRRRVLLARDHFGNTGLHYRRAGNSITCASDLRTLLEMSGFPTRLDLDALAWFLLTSGHGRPDQTMFADIHRVPPGHAVEFGPHGRRQWRYWKIEDTPWSAHHPQELSERVRDTLDRAVESRLRDAGRVGVALSSGLDSSAVCFSAAGHVARTRRKLVAFTAVPTHVDGFGAGALVSEGPDARRACDLWGVPHVDVASTALGPIEGILAALRILREPQAGAGASYWVLSLLGAAQGHGCDVFLTGQVGDFVLGGRRARPTVRTLASAGRWRAAARLAAPNWIRALRAASWQPWGLTQPWRQYSLIHPELLEQTRVLERLRDSGQDIRYLRGNSRDPDSVIWQATHPVGAYWSALGRAFGMAIYDPFQDRDLMELMFSIEQPPAAVANRPIFRRAMAGLLPSEVVNRQTKARQSSDLAARLRHRPAPLEALFDLAQHSPLARSAVDLTRCRSLFRQILQGPAESGYFGGTRLLVAASVLMLITGYDDLAGVDSV